MKASFLSVSILILMVYNLEQNNINFAPKQLFAEIKNISKSENPTFVQLQSNANFAIDTVNERYLKIQNASPVQFVYIGRVKTCRAGGCTSPKAATSNDSYEFFDYFILFDASAKVLSVRIYNYEATHGQEITVKKWLNQFIGYNGSEELTVGKNIDAVSGATISVYSITDNISLKTQRLKRYLLNQS